MIKERLIHLGQTVRRQRRRIGLTQEQLGAPHASKSFISQLERGKVSPSLSTLFHIGDRLELSPAQLLVASDSVHTAAAVLDMAKAALLIEGVENAEAWIRQIDNHIFHGGRTSQQLIRSLHRYEGIKALVENRGPTAIRLLREGQPYEDATHRYWLGLAYHRHGLLLQALQTWEGIEGSEPDSTLLRKEPFLVRLLLHTHLRQLYVALGETSKAETQHEQLHYLIFGNNPGFLSEKPQQTSCDILAIKGHMVATLLWREAMHMWNRKELAWARSIASTATLFASSSLVMD